jgi:hypothetical protein
MRSTIFRAAALAALLLAPTFARAEDVSYASLDDIAKKKGTASAFVLVIAKEDADIAKNVPKFLGDPKLAKMMKDDVPAARLDPTDEAAQKGLGLTPEKADCVLMLDGYGVLVTKHAKAVTVDTLSSLVKQAQDVTKKKKATEKKLDAAVTKGEDTMKKGDTAGACQLFLGVIDMKPQVPCGAIAKAEKHVEELDGKGLALVTQAQAATKKNDFPNAHKLIQRAQNEFPTPKVLEAAKSASTELGQAEKTASGK